MKKFDSNTDRDVGELINHLDLKPHPEGGFYVRPFRSSDRVRSIDASRYHDEERSASSAIYYLLSQDDFSAWHRLKSDEIWHFYKGSPVKLHSIDEQGVLRTDLLGDPMEIRDASFQVVIPAGKWFSAELVDKALYCLVGCTVSPGFEECDFELADRDVLSKQFPEHAQIIAQFTRSVNMTSIGLKPK